MHCATEEYLLNSMIYIFTIHEQYMEHYQQIKDHLEPNEKIVESKCRTIFDKLTIFSKYS